MTTTVPVMTIEQFITYVERWVASPELLTYLRNQKQGRNVKELIHGEKLETKWMLWLVNYLPDSIVNSETFNEFSALHQSVMATYLTNKRPAWKSYKDIMRPILIEYIPQFIDLLAVELARGETK